MHQGMQTPEVLLLFCQRHHGHLLLAFRLLGGSLLRDRTLGGLDRDGLGSTRLFLFGLATFEEDARPEVVVQL